MNTVHVRNITIGEGMPKICVPIVVPSGDAILKEARRFAGLPVDLVEWRLDWFDGRFDLDETRRLLAGLREALGDKPLLATFRTFAEGGACEKTGPGHYENLVRSAVDSGCADLVDVELVLALGYGTAGAALSTMIGQAVAVLFYLPGIFGRSHVLKVRPGRFSPATAVEAFREGFSSSAQYLYQLIFLLLCNNILVRAGNEVSVAVFDMLQNASYLILYLYEGTTRAMQPMVSTYCGEHRSQGMLNTVRYAFTYGCGAGNLSALLIFLFPRAVCALFGLGGGAATEMGTAALRLYCAGTVFAGISILLAGYFQSCGRERESLAISSLRGLIVLIPGVLVFSAFGMDRFWLLFPAVEAVSLGLWATRFFTAGGRDGEFDGARVYTCTVEQGTRDMAAVTAEAEAFCKRWDASPRQTYFVTMTIEELCLVILRDGGGDNVCIEITLVAGETGEFILHIRDTARYFDPFALDTGRASRDGGFDMDAMGVRVIKSKANEFFYRRYGGFNSLVVKI